MTATWATTSSRICWIVDLPVVVGVGDPDDQLFVLRVIQERGDPGGADRHLQRIGADIQKLIRQGFIIHWNSYSFLTLLVITICLITVVNCP